MFNPCDLSEISIHAPREGSDDTKKPRINLPKPFQSTLPVKGATEEAAAAAAKAQISIHAPREGSDVGFNADGFSNKDFNPRSP